MNNSLHLWSEEIPFVEEWIHSILPPEWKFTTQRVESRPVHSIFTPKEVITDVTTQGVTSVTKRVKIHLYSQYMACLRTRFSCSNFRIITKTSRGHISWSLLWWSLMKNKKQKVPIYSNSSSMSNKVKDFGSLYQLWLLRHASCQSSTFENNNRKKNLWKVIVIITKERLLDWDMRQTVISNFQRNLGEMFVCFCDDTDMLVWFQTDWVLCFSKHLIADLKRRQYF